MDKRNNERRSFSQNEISDLLKYLIEAGTIYGKGQIELDGLTYAMTNGEIDFDNWIFRRNEVLFELYEKYKSQSFPNGFRMNGLGIYAPKDEEYVLSRERQNRWNNNQGTPQVGLGWIMTPSLDYFMITSNAKSSHNVTEKYHNLAEKNSFFLPQIAKQLELPTNVYYRGVIKKGKDKRKVHLSKDFIKPDEMYFAGYGFIKSKKKNENKIPFKRVLSGTRAFMLEEEGSRGIPKKETLERFEEVRRGLIKQTFFNKLTLNDDESNATWGLIRGRDCRFHLAPLKSFQTSCGAKVIGYGGKGCHRTASNGYDDIQSFLLEYSKEDWFREWIEDKVLNLDIDRAFTDAENQSKVLISPKEREYYSEVFEKMLDKVRGVFELEYDHTEVRQIINEHRREKKFANVKKKMRRVMGKEDPDEHEI